MNKLKFKISQDPSVDNRLSVNIQLRKWYVAWLWVKTIMKYILNKWSNSITLIFYSHE